MEFIIAILLFGWSTIIATAILLPVILVYFAPFIVAHVRGCEHKWWMLALNVLFGATGVVWIGVMIWAFLDNTVEEECCDGNDCCKSN